MRKALVLAVVLFIAACADKAPDTPDPTKPECQPGVVTSDCPLQ